MADFLSDDQMAALEKSGDFISDEDMSALENADVPSELDSAGRGFAQGATFNLRDEGAGFLENPMGGAKELANKFGYEFADQDVNAYRSERDASRKLDEAAKAANPQSFFAGNVGGALATSVVPGLGPAASLGGSALKGAGMGAAYGLGNSEAEDASDLGLDMLKGGAVGSLAGAGGYGAGKLIGSATNKAVNTAEDVVTAPSGALGRVGRVLSKTVPEDLNKAAQIIPGGSTAQGLIKEFAEAPAKKAASVTSDYLSNLVMKTPEALGKFGRVFKEAVERGPQAVAATHFILEQTNPEYREHIQQLSGNGDR